MANYSVTLQAGTGIDPASLYLWPAGGTYPEFTEIFINCSPLPGYEFAYWQVQGRPGIEPTKEYNFLLIQNMVITAHAVPATKRAYIGAGEYEAYINNGTGWALYEPNIG